MPTDQNPQSGRRQHFHRGRRGPDRRGPDRRPQQPGQERPASDHVDVEQIMRDIRAQISQRHGIELSTQQIQELAARRLEAILDPRTVKPSLLEQLRRSAGSQPEVPSEPQPAFAFEDHTIYESPNGLLRFIRRLLNPILKLFFNPNPLIQALNAQARLNKDAARREAERDRRQVEWNALHYSILQRLVTEISRASIEAQSLSMRVESLGAKVDFNERRVRGMENTAHQSAPAARAPEASAPPPPASSGMPTTDAVVSDTHSEGSRRRRRRRRGRRGPGMGGSEMAATSATVAGGATASREPADDVEDLPEGEGAGPFEDDQESPAASEPFSSEPPASFDAPEPAVAREPEQTERPEPPAASMTPSPAPDEPFPLAPIDPPDQGPADR